MKILIEFLVFFSNQMGDEQQEQKFNFFNLETSSTEEDEEILSALNGGHLASNKDLSHVAGKGSSGGERYERLSPEERAFLAFSNRLKRAPRQVVRYAYGGFPLWSV